jgi:hypothetical protein
MNSVCSQCNELVEPSYRSCPACGADLRVVVPRLVDLTDREIDLEREQADLLHELLAGEDDVPRRARPPRWGANTPTMLDLELAPVRLGRTPLEGDDLLPAPTVHPKRGWRRR